MKKCRFFNGYNKVLSLTLIFILMISCFQFQTVHADHEDEQESISILSPYANDIKPQINVNYLGATPESPMVGQEITLRYEIDPLPFYNNISGDKEIVLVLDVSESMDKNSKLTNLKTAAIQFIDKLTATTENKVTPKIPNLKIGIVTFDSNETIKNDLLQVTNETKVNMSNIKTLKSRINELAADGGTNAEDGLIKGTYVLNKSNPKSHKTIIFMADGEPTYPSVTSQSRQGWLCYCSIDTCKKVQCEQNDVCSYNHGWLWNTKYCSSSVGRGYYTTLDETNPSIAKEMNSYGNGRYLGYATTMGSIIKNEGYNVFTIGYGLGVETSAANMKMKSIHKSMGGEIEGDNKTFFASDTDDIDKVFEVIADTLIRSYTIGEVNLNLDLEDGVTPISGFEVSEGNGGRIAINPIIYTRNENNQYTAEKQYIKVVIKVEKEGDISILKPSSILTYKDIEGKTQKVVVENETINVRPTSIEDEERLSVDFQCIPEGYLIGDIVTGKVTFTRNAISGITYSDGKFTLTDKPSILSYEDSTDSVLDFGTISSTVDNDYKFKINDSDDITMEKETTYTLSGTYDYNLKKDNKIERETGDKTAVLNVKRGMIKAKVLDEEGNDITAKTTLSITSPFINKVTNTMEDEYAVFNTVSSGNYIVGIESLPEGCTKPEVSSTMVRVDYKSNVVSIEFKVKGVEQGETDIISSGIYMNDNTSRLEEMLLESKDSSIKLTSRIPTTLGVLLDVGGKNNEINLATTKGTINYNNIKAYEITESGLSQIEAIPISAGGIKLGEQSSGKCLILYEYIPTKYTSSVTLTASVKNTDKSKVLRLEFGTTTSFNLF